MKYQVELSDQAKRDTRAIGRWLETNRSIDSADHRMIAFARVIIDLETDPSRFPFAEEAADRGMSLPEHHLGRGTNAYRILFEVTEKTVYC